MKWCVEKKKTDTRLLENSQNLDKLLSLDCGQFSPLHYACTLSDKCVIDIIRLLMARMSNPDSSAVIKRQYFIRVDNVIIFFDF